MGKKRFILSVLFFSILWMLQAQDRGFIVETGDQAPDFSMELTDGRQIKLSELKGKVVMLQFTASWCGVCRREMPEIEKQIWQAFKDKGLMVIAIDKDETREKIEQFIAQTGISYPVALDPGSNIFEKYANPKAGVTRNVLIDKNGTIVFLTRLYNENEFNALIEHIKTLLK